MSRWMRWHSRVMVAWWRCPPGAARALALALLVGLATPALVWLLMVPGLREQAAAQRVRSADLQAQLDRAQALLSQTAQEPAADELGADRDAWDWPRLAAAAGLELQQLKTLPAEPGRWPVMQLGLRGRYAQHGAFLALLAAREPAARLVSLQLQPEAAGWLQAELRIECLPPLPGRPARPAPAPAPRYTAAADADPFAPAPAPPEREPPAHLRAALERPREWLEAAPLTAMALVGTLRHGDEWRALVQWQGQVHTVRVGDHLGAQRGRVLQIQENGLRLRELVRDAQGAWSEKERTWRVGEK